jgi:predicted DNA-binding protein
MLTVRLDPELEERLGKLAKATGRTKSHYVREAVIRFLADEENRRIASARLEEGSARFTLDDVKERFDLPVVILSLEEYESMAETMHLLRSPANADRLMRSIGSADAGQVSEHEPPE